MEIALGLLLLLGMATRFAAAVPALLLVAFAACIASAWARGLQIDCGCFGGGDLSAGQCPTYPLDLGRTVVLVAAALFVAGWPRTRSSLDAWLAQQR